MGKCRLPAARSGQFKGKKGQTLNKSILRRKTGTNFANDYLKCISTFFRVLFSLRDSLRDSRRQQRRRRHPAGGDSGGGGDGGGGGRCGAAEDDDIKYGGPIFPDCRREALPAVEMMRARFCSR